ncbi:MAG: hypothetical protein AAGJ81_16060 [Verrucomicrobiota bacterium]
MSQKRYTSPASLEKKGPTKEQERFLLHHGIVSGRVVGRLTEEQAAKMIRTHQRKNLWVKTLRTFILLFLLGAIGVIGYEGWKHFSTDSAQTIPGNSERGVSYVLDTGDWTQWIQNDSTLLVTPPIPEDLRNSLSLQNELFRDVLAERASNEQFTGEVGLEELKSRFPSGEEVSAAYQSTTNRSQSVAGGGYASAGGSSVTYSTVGTKGVLKSYLQRYSARVAQMRFANLQGQAESMKQRIETDIEQLEARSISGNSTSMGAQSRATLLWLKSDLIPYTDQLIALANSAEQRVALDRWISFESSEKPGLENDVDAITTATLPFKPQESFTVAEDSTILLNASVGNRRMVILPDPQGAVRLIPQ